MLKRFFAFTQGLCFSIKNLSLHLFKPNDFFFLPSLAFTAPVFTSYISFTSCISVTQLDGHPLEHQVGYISGHLWFTFSESMQKKSTLLNMYVKTL